MVYIATFFTHYGAMSFHREQKRQGLAAQMMPVPRALSASCGVCVRVEQTPQEALRARQDLTDLEGIYEEVEGGYRPIYQAE